MRAAVDLTRRVCACTDVHLIGSVDELVEGRAGESLRVVQLDRLVGIHDEGNEEREDDVDEEADEGVEVDPTEPPEHHRLVRHPRKCRKHVVSVDEGKETLRGCGEGTELEDKRENKSEYSVSFKAEVTCIKSILVLSK